MAFYSIYLFIISLIKVLAWASSLQLQWMWATFSNRSKWSSPIISVCTSIELCICICICIHQIRSKSRQVTSGISHLSSNHLYWGVCISLYLYLYLYLYSYLYSYLYLIFVFVFVFVFIRSAVRGCPHITSAAGGGGGGKPNADDCWRGGVESEINLITWVYECQKCV